MLQTQVRPLQRLSDITHQVSECNTVQQNKSRKEKEFCRIPHTGTMQSSGIIRNNESHQLINLGRNSALLCGEVYMWEGHEHISSVT